MSIVSLQSDAQAAISLDAWELLDRLPDAILVVETGGGPVLWTNAAAEELFGLGRTQVNGRSLDQLLGAGSTLAGLCNSIGPETWSLRERALRLTGKPPLKEGLYDVQMTQDGTAGDAVVISLREQGLGERLEGLTQNRGTVRTLSGLAAALAHEVKNPLSGIRGAAQLLETAVPAEDSELARLIADEVDRICALLDRMEAFSDRHPMPRKPLNIHEVLDHVVRLGRAGAASEL
ncbi:MAG: PAS domain-containing protein, partial [Rhodospirillaceae bacterium]|nr:PAS domain-containing protein [Rhodospirillaceae bacterium]